VLSGTGSDSCSASCSAADLHAGCDLPFDGDSNGIVDVQDILGTLSMFNVQC
jgi:hypothetical protein